MDPIAAATLLLALIEQLRSTIERENRLLRTMDLEALREVQEQKALLADAFEVELAKLRRNPEVVASLPAEVRRRLDEELRELRAAMRVNLNALLVAREVVERMAQHIAHSLAAIHSGPLLDPSRPRRAEVVPLALDRQV
ncbi:hypothetical protein HRbin40_00433 [bacterium HR40]|nr:hypothetical protein HRbin40_00433 [bacterium HR40]